MIPLNPFVFALSRRRTRPEHLHLPVRVLHEVLRHLSHGSERHSTGCLERRPPLGSTGRDIADSRAAEPPVSASYFTQQLRPRPPRVAPERKHTTALSIHGLKVIRLDALPLSVSQSNHPSSRLGVVAQRESHLAVEVRPRL